MHDLLKLNLLLSLVFHKVSYYFSSVCKWDDVSGNKRVLFACLSLQSFSDASQNDCKEKHANKGLQSQCINMQKKWQCIVSLSTWDEKYVQNDKNIFLL